MPNFYHYKRWPNEKKVEKCLCALANYFRFGDGEHIVFGSCCKGICVKQNYDFISKGAMKLVIDKFDWRKNKTEELVDEKRKTLLIREHTVPGNVIANEIIAKAKELGFNEKTFFKLYSITSEDEKLNDLKDFISNLIYKYTLHSLILREEDEKLNSLNLNHSMPEGFSVNENSDPLERYNHAGIDVIPMPTDWTYNEDKHIITIKKKNKNIKN